MYRVVSRDWWNQYHRLFRKIRNSGRLSLTNIREARLLLESAQQALPSPAATGDESRSDAVSAIAALQEVVDYGHRSFTQELERRKAEAHLGA